MQNKKLHRTSPSILKSLCCIISIILSVIISQDVLAAITKPTLSSPSNNATITTTSQTFSWSHPYNDQYELKIKTNDGKLKYESGKTSSKSKTVNLSNIPLTYGSTYKWYVVVYANRLEDSSADRYFTYKADRNAPVVSSFTVNATSAKLGESFTFSYSVADSGGSNLKQAELWRSTDGNNFSPVSGKVNSHSGTSDTGTFTDKPGSAGTYWYGMHVVDNAIPESNVGFETSSQRKQVSVIQITKPTLDSPTANAIITTSSTTFNWSHPYNDQYECIIKDPTSGAIVHQSGYTNAKSHTVNWASLSSGQTLTYGKQYKWYVVVKVSGLTDSSADRYFTYKRSGSLIPLYQLSITSGGNATIAPQTVNRLFPITVTANDINNHIISDFSGAVNISSNVCSTNPTQIILVNGTSVNQQISVSCICKNVQLTAQAQGVYSISLPFNVTGVSGNHSYIGGTATDGNGQPLAGATVWLNDYNGNLRSFDTGADGRYQYSNLPPGRYSIYTQSRTGEQSQARDVYLTNEEAQYRDISIGSTCNTDGRTPILLVPGIMGSSYSKGGPYPLLPQKAPPWYYDEWKNGSWGLHDPINQVGWRELIKDLTSPSYGYKLGCTLFPVPYDWRMDIDLSSQEYLEKSIILAKSKSGTGKVNVVAHSMGGLLSRAYIQSDRYKGDIEKLALVGTPNNGSGKAYYLWEGGDPLTLDSIALDPINLYTETLNLLHLKMRGELLYDNYNDLLGRLLTYNTDKNRDFIHNDLKSVRQLLPTYAFLKKGNSNPLPLSSDEKNTWLGELNKTFSVRGVDVRLYAGTGEKTIDSINIGKPNDLYVDGYPNIPDLPLSGDGTVLVSSVALSYLSVNQDRIASHALLIDAYKPDIIKFIDGDPVTMSTKSTTKAFSVPLGLATSGNTLSLTVIGRVSPYLSDPLGNKSGINPTTKASENNIPGGQVAIDLDFGSIGITNAADGIYNVTLSGTVSEDYWLLLSYSDGTASQLLKLNGFSNTTVTSFTVTVDSSSSGKLTVNRAPLSPVALRASPIVSGVPETKLTWTASTDAGISGYNIYTRLVDEPFFYKIGTAVSNSFDTGHPWVVDSTVKARLYAVSAIKADGSESFLSNTVKNEELSVAGLVAQGNGEIICSPTAVSYNGTSICSVLPSSGYQIASVSGCDGILKDAVFTTGAINGACTVSATFILTLKGDVDGDGAVNLADVIFALKVMVGMNPANIKANSPISDTDVNVDGKIGMEEVIYILQKVAGMR